MEVLPFIKSKVITPRFFVFFVFFGSNIKGYICGSSLYRYVPPWTTVYVTFTIQCYMTYSSNFTGALAVLHAADSSLTPAELKAAIQAKSISDKVIDAVEYSPNLLLYVGNGNGGGSVPEAFGPNTGKKKTQLYII